MYGKGAGYNVFAGRDASKGLGMSSLDPKDAVSDYSSLNEAQIKTLDQWEGFFEKVSAPRLAQLTPALQRRWQGRCGIGETDARTCLTRLEPPLCMHSSPSLNLTARIRLLTGASARSANLHRRAPSGCLPDLCQPLPSQPSTTSSVTEQCRRFYPARNVRVQQHAGWI
jgi:hypothetical protein